jgi:hypothetical protein
MNCYTVQTLKSVIIVNDIILNSNLHVPMHGAKLDNLISPRKLY